MATMFKRYKSIFGESKQVSDKNLSKKEAIIRSFKKALREEEMAQKDIEEVIGQIESVITDVIDSHGVDNPIVDSLSNTVKDINSQNAIISDIQVMEKKLSKSYTSIFAEAEEDEDEPFGGKQAPPFDAEDAAEARAKKESHRKSIMNRLGRTSIVEEAEEEDEDEEAEEKKESVSRRTKAIKEYKARLKEESEEDEDGDDKMAAVRAAKEESLRRKSRIVREEMEDEDDYEEAVYGFKTKGNKYAEESETDEGDLIDDESGSDYDALSSIDAEGNFSSDRGMEADDDENASQDM